MKERWGDAIVGDAAPGGAAAASREWQHPHLVAATFRGGSQILGFLELCAPNQLGWVRGFRRSTSQVIYSRVL